MSDYVDVRRWLFLTSLIAYVALSRAVKMEQLQVINFNPAK